MVAKVRERFAVSKQAAQKFYMVRYNLRKLSELEVMKQYHIKMPNLPATSKNLNNSEDINRDWENIKESIKTSATESLGLYELNYRKPWLGEKC
jgi:DNA repair ATPase RecN